MGDLKFNVPHTDQYDRRIWDSAYITGIEGIPWRCHHRESNGQFSIGREIDESGKLNIVWPTTAIGNVCISTTSLKISAKPYELCLELARGTVNRMRAQASDWQRMGLRFPDGFFPRTEKSLEYLLRALTSRSDRGAQRRLAQMAIDMALQASMVLCDSYSEQALNARKQLEGRLTTLLGIELEPSPTCLPMFGRAIDTTFNLVNIAADLGAVETASGALDFSTFEAQADWGIRHNKKVCVGPLVHFGKGRLPRWMVLLGEGFESVREAACRHARECVERFQGRAHIWNVAAGLNTPGDIQWSDEEVLRLAVGMIETVRSADQRAPVLLTIDQPWSEYLRFDENGISPLHFADALIRAELGLSGLALDLRFGLEAGQSFPRDLLEISRLIDRWAMLGLPLMVILNAPSTALSEPPASSWQSPISSSGLVNPMSIVRILMSKPAVHGVIWSELRGVPTADGLMSHQEKPKGLVKEFTELRKCYLL
ncbi:MAG: hypothetical protein KDB22_18730 [Planctomycetales bacterium]|nr:hypothetical protein [Planctomycetales bacterium]